MKSLTNSLHIALFKYYFPALLIGLTFIMCSNPSSRGNNPTQSHKKNTSPVFQNTQKMYAQANPNNPTLQRDAKQLKQSASNQGWSIHDIGTYAWKIWKGPNETYEQGGNWDRLHKLNFILSSIKVRDVEQFNALRANSNACQQLITNVHAGMIYSPPKQVLLRIEFWPKSERGGRSALKPYNVYRERVFFILDKLASILGSLRGVVLSEENIPRRGRPEILQHLYDDIKAKYPDLPIFQWWTPMTTTPGTYQGNFLSADGWIINPYYLTKENYPKGPDIKRFIQKYVITGKPVIFVPYATNVKDDWHGYWEKNGWNTLNQQLQLCEDFNLAQVFFWTYSKDHRSGGDANFPKNTSDPLMNRINQRVAEWIDHVNTLPAKFSGNTKVADYWQNPSLSLNLNKSGVLLQDTFSQSNFLDQTSGSGLRDIIWDGRSLKFRGYHGRNVDVAMNYKILLPITFPQKGAAVLNVQVNPSQHGKIILKILSDQRIDSIVTKNIIGDQVIKLDLDTKAAKKIELEIKVTGDAGTINQPIASIKKISLLGGAIEKN